MSRSLVWEVVIGVAIAVIGVAAYFDDRPTYSDLETTVLHEPFLEGRALIYRWQGKILRNCTGAFRREIRQGQETFYLPTRPYTWIPSESWSVGFFEDFVAAVPLGDFEGRLEDGPATYHVTSIGHCNRIQAWFGKTVEEDYPPVAFEISIQP